MHQFYIILVSIILEVAYNVLNRKYVDNFSFINFIYVIKVYFILFLLIYFIKVYIILFLITYLFCFMIIIFAIKVCNKKFLYENSVNSWLFVCSKCIIQSHIIQFTTLSDFICYFSCIYWLFWAIRQWSWKPFEMNSEKVPSWHGIITSPA